MQGESAGLLVAVRVAILEIAAEVGHGLHAELAAQEVGEDHIDFVGQAGIELHGLGQEPAPALAVAAGVLVAFGHVIIDGIALVVHRSAAGDAPSVAKAPAVTVKAFLVIGQLGQVAEVLQPPGLIRTGSAEDHGGEGEVKLGQGVFVLFFLGKVEGSLHQLQGAAAVAEHGGDITPAAPVRPAIKFPGHDGAIMFDVGVTLGRCLQQAPVADVDGNHGLAEIIDLIHAPQLLQTRDGQVHVLAH